MNRRMFVGLMGAAVCSTGRFTTEALAQSKPPDVARMLEVTRVPGVAVAGIKEARPYQLFAGVARAGGPPVTARTIFPAASLSKPVFAWGVQNLVKQGKIDLNRPLQDYVDLGLEGTARKITALHVLTHSTGLVNWRFQPNLTLDSAFDVNRDIAWAPGWGVDRSSKTPSLFHWGDGPGFKNFCWVQPAKKSALVFFTNGDSGAALYAWLFRQLMNDDLSAFYWI